MAKRRVMTEVEWLTAADPRPLLEFVRLRRSYRKFYLFAAACFRAGLPPQEICSFFSIHVARPNQGG